ncbi:galactose ABC transporter substrate-binding protein [Clostridium taeniosporum]|uniref:D-galactose/methyl-galactoside binding periplasmic protein MglB n=1 Tax=Clostridium taeniosporum TaxID=394958 RepID=A0A1D7XPJ6_9CLOT|nr:galactose ABC transporter substrate-binding protein [Clostridium taeniosporum]AOR25130.1 galactose ABC transporter substrate-binding protein [Clostridium taeniosporum]
MKILKKLLILIMILVLTIALPIEISKNNVYAHSNFIKKTPIRVGVFLHSYDDYLSLVKQNLEDIEKENKDKVKFTFFNAKENQALQNASIDKALTEYYDVFIVNLHTLNLDEVGDTLYKIIKENMPLILLGQPNEELIKFIGSSGTFIASAGEQSGTLEGKILADEWNYHKETIDKNGDNILQYIMLKGRIGDPIVDERTKYAVSTLNEAGIKTEELVSINSEWSKDLAKQGIESLFLKYGDKIEAIISNNDAMAIGAIEALQKYGYNKGNKSMTIPVVGIDGIPEAIELVNKGYMTGTVIQDSRASAETLYKVAMNLAYGKPALENTGYKFDDTGAVLRLPYKEYKK